MSQLLEVKELSLSFVKKPESKHQELQETRAVNRLSFELHKGECLAIVGESGCGKSASLLNILALHGPNALSSGEIFLEGQAIHFSSEKQMQEIRGKRIALISQDPMSALNPTMKIAEQISEALPDSFRKNKTRTHKKIIELLKETGISDPELRAQQYPFEFSGGMLQRVAIAMALAGNPDIIMADEPTTALDVTIQRQVLALLKKLQVKKNMALILVSHDLALVSEVADRVLVMYAGELFEQASVEKLFAKASHPYTQALLKALPKINSTKGQGALCSIEGQPPDLSKQISGCAFVARCPHAMQVCVQERPALCVPDKGHDVRCWLYDEEYLIQQGKA